MGHGMRCLALAQVFKNAGKMPKFAMAAKNKSFDVKIKAEGFEGVYLEVVPGSDADSHQVIELARLEKDKIVVVDGYHFNFFYQEAIVEAGLFLVLIDDYAMQARFCAQVILNQNVGASEFLYCNRESFTKLLLGTKYVLLRREYLKWKSWKRDIPARAKNILVTMGGSDPAGISSRIISVLGNLSGLNVKLIAGGANPKSVKLRSEIYKRELKIELLMHRHDMPELLPWAASTGNRANLSVNLKVFPTNLLEYFGENRKPVSKTTGRNQRQSPTEFRRKSFRCRHATNFHCRSTGNRPARTKLFLLHRLFRLPQIR